MLDSDTGLLYAGVEEDPAGPNGLVAIALKSRHIVRRISADAAIPH
ncbi:hypothetical protein [Nocardia sp. NPDC057440]